MSEQSHEFSAKSVEIAIEDGLRQLGVGQDKVDIEILHEGSRGLLGLGSTNARVRLTLRTGSESSEEPAPTPADAPQPTAAADAVVDEIEEPNEDEPEVAVQDTPDDGVDNSNSDGGEDDSADISQDEITSLASETLLEMVTLMGMDARVEASNRDEPDEDDTTIYLNLVGDDLDSLIGRHGETLSSIQYLVRLMVNQKLHRWTNIVVDVDGYKERRAERLAQMALRMADQVVETGRTVALEPMPGNERRLIHIALRDHPQVYTESIGEDTRRKIQILLK